VTVSFGDEPIATTNHAVRVLETSHPPTFYIPPGDVVGGVLEPDAGSSVCEWKGTARYWRLSIGDVVVSRVAWSYPHPAAGFHEIAGHLAFYPSKVRCTVGGVEVQAQEGDFYGGWITPDIVGPFKGGNGTWRW
jgi:uncharacterized protein (DUF427 family)